MIDVVVLKDETRAVQTRATRTRTPRPCSEFQEETRKTYVASRVSSRGKGEECAQTYALPGYAERSKAVVPKASVGAPLDLKDERSNGGHPPSWYHY